MGFRVVWRGKFGQESSQLIDELARARLVADSLASRNSRRTIVHVIDAKTNKIVYSTFHESAMKPAGSRSGSGPKSPSSSI